MKHFTFYIFCILFTFTIIPSLTAQTTVPDKQFIVVLDPGHGGKDPGALVGNIQEKDIVLNVSKRVGEYLNKFLPSVKVIYTRSTDKFIQLNKRAEIANKAKANLFLSIHANACGAPYIYGTETYTLGLHKSQENLEVAKKENSAILYEDNYSTTYQGFNPNSAESYIIFELMQNAYLDQSIHFAQIVQNQFRERVGRKDRGVRQAGFLVLRETAMPSALIELGYLTNSKEKNYLASDKGQVYLASAIFRSIKEYAYYHNLIDNTTIPKQESAPVNEKVTEETTTNTSTKTTNIETGQLAVSPKETRTEIPKEIVENSIEFCVQIGASLTKIKNPNAYFKVSEPISMKFIAGRFKYFVGCSTSYQNCLVEMRKVRKVVKGAFPVAFENSKPMNLQVARKRTNQ